MVPATQRSVQYYLWNEDTSFNQDTLTCPKGVRNRGAPLYTHTHSALSRRAVYASLMSQATEGDCGNGDCVSLVSMYIVYIV